MLRPDLFRRGDRAARAEVLKDYPPVRVAHGRQMR